MGVESEEIFKAIRVGKRIAGEIGELGCLALVVYIVMRGLNSWMASGKMEDYLLKEFFEVKKEYKMHNAEKHVAKELNLVRFVAASRTVEKVHEFSKKPKMKQAYKQIRSKSPMNSVNKQLKPILKNKNHTSPVRKMPHTTKHKKQADKPKFSRH